MTDTNRLVDQCMHRGLMYLAESLQYYWPANYAVISGERQDHSLNEFAENNIALHLARAFAEKGFQVWAEVPISGENRRLDFLAYNYVEKISVALELKKTIETPQSNLEDLRRLVVIHNNDLGASYKAIDDEMTWMYGIVAIFAAKEFAAWWRNPEGCNYTPEERQAKDYEKIGKAIAAASHRYVMPLVEWPKAQEKYRLCRAAYALYDEEKIIQLEAVLKHPEAI